MRLLRTSAGEYLNVEKVVRLIDERRDAADSWVENCKNGE
jgi:hypothetical protein